MLCVNLIGPYTLKGKDNSQIDFMSITMINPTSSWFKIAEFPVVEQLHRQTVNGKELLIADEIFDKASECIAKLVNKTWLCRYPRCHHLIYNKPIGPAAIRHMDRQTVSSIYYYCYVRTYVVRIMYDT